MFKGMPDLDIFYFTKSQIFRVHFFVFFLTPQKTIIFLFQKISLFEVLYIFIFSFPAPPKMVSNEDFSQNTKEIAVETPPETHPLFTERTSTAKSQKSTDASLSCIQKFLLIFYLFIIIIAALVIILVPPVKAGLIILMTKINQDMSWEVCVYLFLLGLGLTLIGFPIMLYEMALGFMMDDYLLAVLVDVLFKYSGITCLFFFSRHVLKPRLEILFRDSLIFKSIQRAVDKNPWKACILIKVLVIPHIFKNCGLGITSVTNFQFLLVSLINCTFYAMIWVYFGSEMKSLNDVFNSKGRPVSYSWMKYTMLGLTVVILILMFVTAKIYFDEIKKEIETEQKISDGWRDVFASGKF